MLLKKNISTPDALIVLANQMDSSGVLNDESKSRAILAVEIFKKRNIPRLVTCGWAYRSDCNIEIAKAFKDYITQSLGISPERIITELKSRDTVGDAYFTKINLAIPCSWRRVCIVTSDYHLRRTREIFRFIYGSEFILEFYGATTLYGASKELDELRSTSAFRETFQGIESGNDLQIAQRLSLRHPFYNGQIYNQIKS